MKDMKDASLLILSTLFAVTNITSFVMMFIDKERSKKDGTERIPEGILFFMAIAFGSFGVSAGMFTFRHKTRRWYFLVGIPLLMLENLAFLYLAYLIVSGNFQK